MRYHIPFVGVLAVAILSVHVDARAQANPFPGAKLAKPSEMIDFTLPFATYVFFLQLEDMEKTKRDRAIEYLQHDLKFDEGSSRRLLAYFQAAKADAMSHHRQMNLQLCARSQEILKDGTLADELTAISTNLEANQELIAIESSSVIGVQNKARLDAWIENKFRHNIGGVRADYKALLQNSQVDPASLLARNCAVAASAR